jgi:hypothetical protein
MINSRRTRVTIAPLRSLPEAALVRVKGGIDVETMKSQSIPVNYPAMEPAG